MALLLLLTTAVMMLFNGGGWCIGGKRKGHHGNGPTTQSHSREGLALCVKKGDEARRHVPVAPEVEILHRVHGEVLQLVEPEAGGEEVQPDHGPVDVLRRLLARLVRRRNGLVEVSAERARGVNPLDEEGEHGRRLAG